PPALSPWNDGTPVTLTHRRPDRPRTGDPRRLRRADPVRSLPDRTGRGRALFRIRTVTQGTLSLRTGRQRRKALRNPSRSVDVRGQRGDHAEVAEPLRVVQPVAHDELVRDLEADVAQRHLDLA